MDGDFGMNLRELLATIDTAEVVCLYFPVFRKTLVVDTRTDIEDPPLVKLVPMAESVEERMLSLKKLRPRFPQPEKVAVLPWPRYVDSLVRLGVWDRLVQRCVATGDKSSVRRCQAAFDELRRLERSEMLAVINGDEYQTIWQAKRR